MKTAEELATQFAKSKNYITYGINGFGCQIHYPQLCEILKEHDREIISLVDEMIERDRKLAEIFDNDAWRYSKIYNEPYNSRVTIILNELKQKILGVGK